MNASYSLVIRALNFRTNTFVVMAIDNKIPEYSLGQFWLDADVVCNTSDLINSPTQLVTPKLSGVIHDPDKGTLKLVYSILIPFTENVKGKWIPVTSLSNLDQNVQEIIKIAITN